MMISFAKIRVYVELPNLAGATAGRLLRLCVDSAYTGPSYAWEKVGLQSIYPCTAYTSGAPEPALDYT